MTVHDRLLNAIRGDVVDRVPLMLQGFERLRRSDVEAISDPLHRDVAERVFDDNPDFMEHPSHVNRYLVTPDQFIREVSCERHDGEIVRTTEVSTPKGMLTAITKQLPSSRTEWTVKYPVETREDIDKLLSVQWETPEGLAPADYSAMPDEARDRCITRTGISSPFVCVGGVMSYQSFLELCAADYDLVRELTEVCAERIDAIMDVVFSGEQIEYVWIGGCEWLTPPMGSPRLYEELVQPYETRIIERAHDHGAVVHVHCHGNVRSTLQAVIDRGGDFFEPVEPPPDGDITLAEAKQAAGGRITLGGNVEARVIEFGDADEVEAATRSAFEGGSERLILKATEGLTRPYVNERMHENYHRLIDVWEELSPIA